MFIGKSVLASFLLSTVVITSGAGGGAISGGNGAVGPSEVQETEAVQISSMEEALQNSDMSGGQKAVEGGESAEGSVTAQKQEAVEGPDGAQAKAAVTETGEENGAAGEQGRNEEQNPAGKFGQELEETEEAADSRVPLLEGTSLAMLASRSRVQMLSSVIRSEDGRLVVVDGGWQADGDYLLETIKANGGSVDAWLITHPHSDHVGALYHILRNYSDEIDIKKIYYSFAPVSWYEEVDPIESDMMVKLAGEFENLPEDMLCGTIKRGDRFSVGNLRITVVNDRYCVEEDPVNNSSIVYRIDAGRKSILFLGDMSDAGGSLLVRDAGSKIDADIVQMAHHGQYGIGHSVYQLISPKICLWPTPEWLWNNDNGGGYNSGPWQTILTRNFMETINVKQQYCTKDGDIVLSLK